jgi:hypothetical protein
VILLVLFFTVSKIYGQGMVQAKWTEDFVNSIAINGNWDMSSAMFDIRMKESGIRFVRFNIQTGGFNELSKLYNFGGIKGSIVPNPGTTPAAYKATISPHKQYIDQLEGSNEPNIWPWTYKGLTDGGDLFPATNLFFSEFYDLMKADPKTANIPIASPDFATSLGDIPKFIKGCNNPKLNMDRRNVHFYPNTHWGSDTRPTQNESNAQLTAILKAYDNWGNTTPLIMTETGYSTKYEPPVDDNMKVSHLAYAKYSSRIFAENFKLGVMRTYLFKLMGDGGEEAQWGICKSNVDGGTPYGAFYAIKNLIGLLSDATWDSGNKTWSKTSFTPDSLDYTILNALSTTKSLLLQKSNGDFYLLIWQNVNVFNTQGTNYTDLNPAEDVINIRINNATISSATQYKFKPTTTTCDYTSTLLAVDNGNHIKNINVPDHVLIIKLVVKSLTSSNKVFNTGNAFGANIYPNPLGEGFLNIDYKSAGDNEVAIYDISGRRIYHKLTNSSNLPISHEEFDSGLYIVNLRSGTNQKNMKLSVQ